MIKKKLFNIYSKEEIKIFFLIHKIKSKILKGITCFLSKLGVSANLLSFLGGILIFLSLLFSIFYENLLFFLVGLWLQVTLDGVDGAVARYQKKDCFLGSFIDSIFDYFGIFLAGIYTIYFNLADPINILIYTVLYAFLIFNSFFLLYYNDRYKFTFRPRFVIFIIITIDVIYKTKLSDYFILISSSFLIIFDLIGFVKISRNIQKIKNA